jgi:DeoR family deoxyribose operon repressor
MASRRETRIATLSDALSARRVVHLKEAAALLGVSEMTVRRDVADHPGLFGYLGGHIVPAAEIESDAPYELARAADSHAAAKRQACIHAARHIRPDETIFIDCGTTLEYLVELIPDDYAITAICYSLNTAERLTRKKNLRMVMLGGVYHPSSASFSGAPGIETLDQLGINVAFLSAEGDFAGARELPRRRQQQARQAEGGFLCSTRCFPVAYHGRRRNRADACAWKSMSARNQP